MGTLFPRNMAFSTWNKMANIGLGPKSDKIKTQKLSKPTSSHLIGALDFLGVLCPAHRVKEASLLGLLFLFLSPLSSLTLLPAIFIFPKGSTNYSSQQGPEPKHCFLRRKREACVIPREKMNRDSSDYLEISDLLSPPSFPTLSKRKVSS
jgi:hypothetical protein